LHVYTVIITINFRFIMNIKFVIRHSLCISGREDSLTKNYYLKDMGADIYSLGVPYINLERQDWPQSSHYNSIEVMVRYTKKT
jgi:hypothetical protein